MLRLIPFLYVLLLFLSCTQRNNSTTDSILTDTLNHSEEPDTLNTRRKNNEKEKIAADRLIKPGKKIGKTALGLNAAQIEDLLGKPDMSDAAMGKAWLTWYGKHRDEHNNKTELNIYTTYKDSNMKEKTVQQIRVTSSYFITEDSLGVYSSLEAIKKYFPDLKILATYRDGERLITIYDDKAKGIAFETAEANGQHICIGVIIHPPGMEPTQTYIYLKP